MPKIFSAYERCPLCEAGRSPESNAFLTDIMNTDRKHTQQMPESEHQATSTPSGSMKSKTSASRATLQAGLEHNSSQFIVKRIFGEEFVVIKRDPSKTQFIARLNDFYFQFQKLGNNYNQIVKAVNRTLFQRRYPASDRYAGATDPRAESPQYRDSEPCKTSCGWIANIRLDDRPTDSAIGIKYRIVRLLVTLTRQL